MDVHHHFKSLTSLSPLQFQKQLRLVEARWQMLADDSPPSIAALNVGYESVTQFTQEYTRMFGLRSVRETRETRNGMRAA
ncbi:helix-turn-helix domain-containing protein [Rhizobium sp.]